MLFKKSLIRSHPQYNFCMRLFLLLPILSLMTSCATVLPGLDRILFSNSSAKVGPIVNVDEQYPASDDEASEKQSIVESMTDSSEHVSEVKADQKSDMVIDSESAKSEKALKSSTVDQQIQTKKVKPRKTSKLESPGEVSQEIAAEKEKQAIAVEYGAVAGKVVLIGEKDEQLLSTGTLITLTPTTMVNQLQDRPPEVHIIDMEDKTYQPRYSTVHPGDQVVFVNKDSIQHNVFSSSGNNAFDLGTYGAGLKRAVTLNELGVVKIYCNIHSEMATFVAVGNEGLSVRADDQGRYQIDQVLPGTYEVAIWNIRGETKRIIEVKADDVIELNDRIETAALRVDPHKNKFGGDYPKNSTLFEDEFY